MNLVDHIERVKGKPHHVKKTIAFWIAGIITATLGLLWLGVGAATGAFAIADTSFADLGNPAPVATTTADSTAIGAASAALNPSGTARIEVVNKAIDTTEAPKEEQTIIPF